MLLMVCTQSHLAHEFGPAVFAVCAGAALFEWIGPLLLEIGRGAVGGRLLQASGVDARGGSEGDFPHARLAGLIKDHAIQDHVRGAVRWMGVDEAAAAMASGQVEDYLLAAHDCSSEVALAEVTNLQIHRR